MNVVRFVVRRAIQWDGWVVIPHIDDHDLRSLLKAVELPFAIREKHRDLAGDYDGVPLDIVRPPSMYLLGSPAASCTDPAKTALLECKCGCEGCWPFLVRIAKDGDAVSWSDFEQPHRGPESAAGHWTYGALPTWHFSLGQYEAAVAILRNAAPCGA
jgi:hypothetical protein